MAPDVKDTIQNILQSILEAICKEVDLEFQKEGDQWRIIIQTENEKSLLDDKGEVLKALQHLVRVLVHKKYPDDRTHFLIDINGFRNNREIKLKNAIPDLANSRVLTEGRTVVLIGLSGYERMLVHKLLADVKGLQTNSVGFGSGRKLLIMPSSEFGASKMEDSLIWDINAEK